VIKGDCSTVLKRKTSERVSYFRMLFQFTRNKMNSLSIYYESPEIISDIITRLLGIRYECVTTTFR